MALLSVQADAKTIKGEPLGWRTAILYMSPYKSAGPNICPSAELAKCHKPCLVHAGRGVFSNVKKARIRRTELFHNDRTAFFNQLIKEIKTHKKSCLRSGLLPAVRLNGTSDIAYYKIKHEGKTIFEHFPDVQFYDYTKRLNIPNNLPENYHLTWSYSGANEKYASMRPENINWAVVFRRSLPIEFLGRPVVDGDLHDLRFLDHPGVVVGLSAKGPAKKDNSGFVQE